METIHSKKVPLDVSSKHRLNGVGQTIWEVTKITLPEGEEGEKLAQEIREDKRRILRREYWRCPTCQAKVDRDVSKCGACGTEKPPSTILDDNAEITKLVRVCKHRLQAKYKNSPMNTLGALSLRELFMHIGIVLAEIDDLKNKGFLE